MSDGDSLEQLELDENGVQAKRKPGRPKGQTKGRAKGQTKSQTAPKGIVVAVDLGNATTLIAYQNEREQKVVVPDAEGNSCTPTVIAFPDGDHEKPLIGQPAKNYRRIRPEHCFDMMKRARGHGDVPGLVDKDGRMWTVEENESRFLQELLRHAEEMTGMPIVGVLMCVPADFNDAQRRATIDVVQAAGYDCIGTVNEPTAAIVSYAHGKDGIFVVVDIGGGTTDVSIVHVVNGTDYTILGTAGRDDRGGREFTSAIVEWCLDHAQKNGAALDPEQDTRGLVLLEVDAESAKQDLTTQESASISFRAKERLFDLTLTRAVFESLVAPLCEDIFALLTESMVSAKLQPEQVDGVVFAGGGSRVPCARSRIEALFGPEKMRKNIDVDKAIVLGAVDLVGVKVQERIAGGDLALESQVEEYQLKSEVRLREVLGQALGVLAIATSTGRELMAPIVEQGTSLPVTASQTFGLVAADLPPGSANIVVLQGKALADPAHCHELQTFRLDGMPPGPMNSRVRVTFAIDTNGLVEVHAVDTFSGVEIAGRVDARSAVAQGQLG